MKKIGDPSPDHFIFFALKANISGPGTGCVNFAVASLPAAAPPPLVVTMWSINFASLRLGGRSQTCLLRSIILLIWMVNDGETLDTELQYQKG